MSTTSTELRGFKALNWQPTPEKWAKHLAGPTPDQVRDILRAANATGTKAHKTARRRLSKVSE
jgi:hypothetical protein